MLEAVVVHRVGDGRGVDPRATKRRPEKLRYLNKAEDRGSQTIDGRRSGEMRATFGRGWRSDPSFRLRTYKHSPTMYPGAKTRILGRVGHESGSARLRPASLGTDRDQDVRVNGQGRWPTVGS